MNIEHLAIWTQDLERLRRFYETYFHARAGERYESRRRPFSSYFLAFDSGARLELMEIPELHPRGAVESVGLAHFAFSTGSREQVDALTERLRDAGYAVVGEPRETGDGYYESVIADPDGNIVELTA